MLSTTKRNYYLTASAASPSTAPALRVKSPRRDSTVPTTARRNEAMATVSTEPQSVTQPSAPAPRDFRQEVTDRIISMLEKGVAPWQKPWNPAEASVAMPR